MTPIFAGVVAYVDINNNLDLISASQQAWVTQMWLAMLLDQCVTTLRYSDIMSAGQRKAELTKIPVKMYGCGGHPMKAKLPFSWVIKNHVDELLHRAKTTTGDSHSCLKSVMPRN